MGNLSEHFDTGEMTCHCGCGSIHVENIPIKMLEEIRAYLGAPMIVHCCTRCEKHNAAVGGVKNSNHITSHAVDFHCKGMSIASLHKMMRTAFSNEMFKDCGIGFYDWGIHVDDNGHRTWNG